MSFLKSNSKKLEASSFNNIKWIGFTAWLSCVFAWARMLVISIKQINAILFLLSFKKIASKIDKHVMLKNLLWFNKRFKFDFFKLYPKFPRARAKQTRWKFAASTYYHREKPNLKSLS